MTIPTSSILGFLGIISLGVGVFLILTGLNIVSIQQVTVLPGKKTWTVGFIFAVIGIGFLISEIIKNVQPTTIATQTPVALTAYSNAFNPEAVYKIVSVYSNKTVAINGGSQDDDALIIQDTWRNWKHQLWKFEALKDGDEGYYLIRSAHSYKCLDVIGSSVMDGASIIQYTCSSTNNQKWKVIPAGDSGFVIQAKHSDKVLEISSLLDSIPVIQNQRVEGKNQLWRIELVEQSPSSEPTPALGAPVITDVKIREDKSSNGLIIYQDVYFQDSDGDAYYTDWQITSTTNPEAKVVNGTITSTNDQQKAGTFTTGTWTCGSGGAYSIKFWVTILDRAGNESNGFEYVINCK
jgi:hypothetical protein